MQKVQPAGNPDRQKKKNVDRKGGKAEDLGAKTERRTCPRVGRAEKSIGSGENG